MTSLRLDQICRTLKKTVNPQSFQQEVFWHFSIPAFDSTGRPECVEGVEIQSNKLAITEPCILFSRLNPRIPRVWDLTNMTNKYRSIASTEFVPFVIESPEKVHSRYLFWFLHTEDFLAAARSGVRAATKSRGRADKSILFDTLIPLPTFPEQQRIAAILDKADAIRRKRQAALQLTEELLRSAFLEMFGDPVTNPKGWPIVRFIDLLAKPLRNGISPASGGKHNGRVLTLSAITGRAFNPLALKIAAFANEFSASDLVDKRDFLICRGNGNLNMVGRGKYPHFSMPDVVFPDTMIAAHLKEDCIEPAYLEAVWHDRMVRTQIESSARTTNGTYKVNQTMVEAITLPLPPKAIQNRFAQIRSRVERIRQKFAAPDAENLFHSLVQRAFRGEL